MEIDMILSILLIIYGLILLFPKFVIRITGKSKILDFTLKQRKQKLLMGGIFCILLGWVILIATIKK